jgi:hypothetical protein
VIDFGSATVPEEPVRLYRQRFGRELRARPSGQAVTPVQAWQGFCEYGEVLEAFSLHERRTLVTGARTGICRAIARALTAAGARVAITDLDLSAAEAAAAELGEPAIALRLDVTDAEATEAVVNQVVDRLGGLDVVSANAGSRP